MNKKLKILHLTTHINSGGITVYILRLIDSLRALGTEIEVLSSGGEYETFFREKNTVLHDLPIRTKSELSPKIYFALPALIKIIKERNIDILHAHTRITQVMACWASRKTGIPVVSTCHGFYKRRLGRRINPSWGRKAIAISDLVADHLKRDFKVPESEIQMINNAVDLEALDSSYAKHDPVRVRAKYGFNTNDPVVGVVARLVADKGHSYLIQAIHSLRSEFPAIRCVIVGQGRERPKLEREVKRLNLTKHCYFTGNVHDVSEPLSCMDVFALPATWREGFGLSIVEAMACHKPVIVSNIWALNSLIQDQETGLLVPPKDAEALAGSIRILLKNKELSARIGKSARDMVAAHFTIPRMAGEIRTLYDKVLSSA